MLVGKIAQALVQHLLSRARRAGFAAVMNDRRFRIKPDLESELPDPIAEVHVLTVHENPWIESPDPFKYLPSYPEISAGNPVDPVRFVVADPVLMRKPSQKRAKRREIFQKTSQSHTEQSRERSRRTFRPDLIVENETSCDAAMRIFRKV